MMEEPFFVDISSAVFSESAVEIHGPLFMSYAVAGHIQFRLTQIPGGAELSLRHRFLGEVEENHRQGITHGWQYFLDGVKQFSE